MPHRVMAEAVRVKMKAWDAQDNDAKAKRYMNFVEWNFKFIAWCAGTAAVMKVGRLTGSDAALALSIYMTGLLAVFVHIKPFNWIMDIIEIGRASDTKKKKWISLGVLLVVSLPLVLATRAFMGQVIDLIIALSK